MASSLHEIQACLMTIALQGLTCNALLLSTAMLAAIGAQDVILSASHIHRRAGGHGRDISGFPYQQDHDFGSWPGSYKSCRSLNAFAQLPSMEGSHCEIWDWSLYLRLVPLLRFKYREYLYTIFRQYFDGS